MKRDFDWNMMPYGVAYCRLEPNEAKGQDCILMEYNQAFSALALGDSRIQDLSGRRVDEFISVGDRERFVQYVQDIVAAQGDVCAIECKFIGIGETPKTVYWKGSLISADEELWILLSTVEFDHFINERKMLLDAVHANQMHAQRVEELIRQMAVGAAVFEENKGFNLKEGNSAFFKIVGYSKTEMIEHKIDLFDLIIPEDREKLRDIIEESRANGKSGQIEVGIRRSNGEYHCAVLQSSLFRKVGENNYFTIIGWDITERKALEEDIRLLNEQYELLQEISNETPMEYEVATKKYKLPVRFKEIMDGKRVQYITQERALAQMHPDDREAYEAAYEEASKKGDTGQY